VPGLGSKELLDLFDAAGLRVSAGSACSAAKAAPSYVLDAMGVPAERSASAVRLSFGPLADDAFIEDACARIAHCGRALVQAKSVAQPAPRLQQLESGGTSGWLLFDDEGRHGIAIDPPAALAARIAADLCTRNCRLLACFDTGTGTGGADALCDILGMSPGWPGGAQQVRFGRGTLDAIALGQDVLAKTGDGYLLGRPEHGELAADAVRFVFGAAPSDAGLDAALCCHRAGEPAVSRTAAAALADDGIDLDPTTAAAYLAAHPDALLVDVRELPEHAACCAQLRGHAAQHVPLSQLAGQAAHWLREPRPLVFLCRSGNRSARAARLLRRLGHAQAWHVAGGLALAG
ncbi:MAG: cysteine desulfurase, partial [Caulobacteraceae bacterium]